MPALVVGLILSACAGTPKPPPAPVPAPAIAEVDVSLFLVGDGGKPDPGGDAVLIALTEQLGLAGGERWVVFLGDNVYPAGIPASTHPDRVEMERRLDDQIDAALDGGARVVLVPGNHDWDNGGSEGWARILESEQHIDRRGDDRVVQLPRGGCVGPEMLDAGDRLRMIFIDSQWFIHGHDKPGPESDDCPAGTAGDAMALMATQIAGAGDRVTAVFTHHPLRSSAEHSGHFTWKDHLFPVTAAASWAWLPLPIIGSLYPASRQLGITSQDQTNSKNKQYQAALNAVFEEHTPLFIASGHEHTLEVLEWDPVPYQLVSGTGYYGHTSPPQWRDESVWVGRKSGFMRVDFLRDDRVRLEVFSVDETAVVTSELSMLLDPESR